MRHRLLVLAVGCLLALTACADDDNGGTPEPSPPATPADPQQPTPGPDTTAPPGGTPPPGMAEPAPNRPDPGSCVDVPEAPDGLYAVADAGTVVVQVDGDRLQLGEVEAADGWTYEVTESDDDEIEIEFRRNGEELEFEAELDDGRVEVKICDDD